METITKRYPMAQIPTFNVPLSKGLHILSLRYLWGARTASAGAAVMPVGRPDPGR